MCLNKGHIIFFLSFLSLFSSSVFVEGSRISDWDTVWDIAYRVGPSDGIGRGWCLTWELEIVFGWCLGLGISFILIAVLYVGQDFIFYDSIYPCH